MDDLAWLDLGCVLNDVPLRVPREAIAAGENPLRADRFEITLTFIEGRQTLLDEPGDVP